MKSAAISALRRSVDMCVLSTVLALAACMALPSQGGRSASFAVVDSGVVGDPSVSDKPIWIDNQRLLYVEQTNEKRTRASDGYQFSARRVVLWNVQTQRITRMHELTGYVCYRDGYFHSALWDFAAPERFPVLHTYGRLDSGLHTIETEWKNKLFDPATCRPKSESPAQAPPVWTQGKTVKVLDEINGILVLDDEKAESLRNRPVTFHPNGAATGIPMPFNAREHHIQGYHPFKGAYFILGSYFVKVPGHPDGGYGKSPWPEGAAQPYWWLYPDGRVESGQLAPNQGRNVSETVPYRDGYLWHGGPMGRETLYRADERGDTSVAKGFAQQMVTSPDGCRIAMNHRRSINDPWTAATLKVIELCKGEHK
jgi:hypothetical protein